jgi:hypothetical protein
MASANVWVMAAGCAPASFTPSETSYNDAAGLPAAWHGPQPANPEVQRPPALTAVAHLFQAADGDVRFQPTMAFTGGAPDLQLQPGDIEFVPGHGLHVFLGKDRTYRVYGLLKYDFGGRYWVNRRGGGPAPLDPAQRACTDEYCFSGSPINGFVSPAHEEGYAVLGSCETGSFEVGAHLHPGVFLVDVPASAAGCRVRWKLHEVTLPRGTHVLYLAPGVGPGDPPPAGSQWIRGRYFSLRFLDLPSEGWPQRYRLAGRDLAVEAVGGCGYLEGTRVHRSARGDTSLVGTFCGDLEGLVSPEPVPVVLVVGPGDDLLAARALPGLVMERTEVHELSTWKPEPDTNHMYATYRALPGADLSSYKLRCADDVDTRESIWMLQVDTVPAEGPVPLTCVGPKRGTTIADQDYTVWPAPRIGPTAVTVLGEDRVQVVNTDGISVTTYAPVAIDDGIRVDPESGWADFDQTDEVWVWLCVLPESGVRPAGDEGPKVNATAASCGWAISKPAVDER